MVDQGSPLSGLPDELKGKVADALDGLKDEAKKALDGAVGKAGDALSGQAPIPTIEGSSSLKDSLTNGLVFLGSALKDQVTLALTEMAKASAEHAKAATDVVLKMQDLGVKVLAKQISPETAEIAIDNYLHALDLYKSALVNEAKVQSYLTAKSLLETAKRVLFALLRFGLQAAAPGAASVLDGIGQLASNLRS